MIYLIHVLTGWWWLVDESQRISRWLQAFPQNCQVEHWKVAKHKHSNKLTEVKRAEAKGNLSNSTSLYLVSRLSGFTEIQIYRDHLLTN